MEYIGKVFTWGRNQEWSERECFLRGLADYFKIFIILFLEKEENSILESHCSFVMN